eukprot:5118877-Pyramimonas_sp.AAC.2
MGDGAAGARGGARLMRHLAAVAPTARVVLPLRDGALRRDRHCGCADCAQRHWCSMTTVPRPKVARSRARHRGWVGCAVRASALGHARAHATAN